MKHKYTNAEMYQAGVELAEAMSPGNGALIAATTTAYKLLRDAAAELRKLRGDLLREQGVNAVLMEKLTCKEIDDEKV